MDGGSCPLWGSIPFCYPQMSKDLVRSVRSEGNNAMIDVTVDPNDFRVPYAFGMDSQPHQIRDGKPRCDVYCPWCRGQVSFVSETLDVRAAHFRHRSTADCDVKAHQLQETIHNTVRDAAIEMLNGRYVAADICKGQGSAELPRGLASAEKTATYGGKTYRPDITVETAHGQKAPVLELEVVWSHPPDDDRLETAADAGRSVGIMNVKSIEDAYLKKLWANERFDIPEACKAYIAEKRFSILGDAGIRRILRGTINRKYKLATLRPEHRQQSGVYPYGFAIGGWPKTWTGKVVSRKDWANLSDWERHGSTGKVFCGLTKKWIEQETA